MKFCLSNLVSYVHVQICGGVPSYIKIVEYKISCWWSADVKKHLNIDAKRAEHNGACDRYSGVLLFKEKLSYYET